MARPSLETIRRVRLGNLRRLLRHRCGHVLPDDDAGREYLEELVRMTGTDKNVIDVWMRTVEVWAPWMHPTEAGVLIDNVKRLTPGSRWSSPEALGQRLRVTNMERERLKLWQIRPSGHPPPSYSNSSAAPDVSSRCFVASRSASRVGAPVS